MQRFASLATLQVATQCSFLSNKHALPKSTALLVSILIILSDGWFAKAVSVRAAAVSTLPSASAASQGSF